MLAAAPAATAPTAPRGLSRAAGTIVGDEPLVQQQQPKRRRKTAAAPKPRPAPQRRSARVPVPRVVQYNAAEEEDFDEDEEQEEEYREGDDEDDDEEVGESNSDEDEGAASDADQQFPTAPEQSEVVDCTAFPADVQVCLKAAQTRMVTWEEAATLLWYHLKLKVSNTNA